jgi:pilus assembly protein CpaC
MNTLMIIRKFSIAFLILSAFSFLLSAFSLLLPYPCWGQGPPRITLETTSPQKLNLTVGKSIIITSPGPVKRVSLVASEIADAMVLTPHQIYLTGKAPGVTNLTLWGVDNKVSAILDLEVSMDTSRLKEMLHKILPEEKDIKVNYTHDSITLYGTVSSTSNLSQVLALTQSYLPKEGKVINLLEVAGVHQVMLEVRVAEMSRSLLRRLGFNFNYLTPHGNFGLSLLNRLTSVNQFNIPGTGGISGSISESVNAVLRFSSHGTPWTVFIDALKEQGLLKVLAEPTLITLSGKTANFLAGGEFPIPVPQSSGAGGTTITIEYKPFGVGLNFSPTVLSNKKISMQVAPEVSELDFSRAVTIGGFVVPAITTRRVSTVIELADGQSFAIAGLLNEQIRENIQKFPILGEIPVLGALFRSSSFQKNETELIIIVTPHLVKPLDMAKQTLPTDQFIEPDDFEFYLLGNLEGKEKIKSSAPVPKPSSGKTHGLEGSFGHIVPK